jgi:glycosyltransferase involved in cell wall biosynthesis
MKVLLLTTHLNTGGITSYLLTLCAGLRKRQHEVWVVSSGGNTEDQFKLLGVNVVNLPFKTKSELSWRIYAALKPVATLIRENHIDVIHAHTRITQVMAAFLSNVTRRPFVTTCHGFFKPRFFRRVFPCWGRRAIAISQAVNDHLVRDFKIPQARVNLVASGVDTNNFHAVTADEKYRLRQKYNLKDEPVAGIIARLSEVKGQDILIKAMSHVLKEIPHAKLLIIGEGKTEVALRALTDEFKLSKSIFFYPIVNRTQEILPMLDVFVMPSRQEGLGLSVMEAHAAGIAVVASNVGGLPTLIEDGVTGFLVPAENEAELARKIVHILENKELAKKMGEAGRMNVLKNHRADQMVEKIIAVYDEVRVA